MFENLITILGKFYAATFIKLAVLVVHFEILVKVWNFFNRDLKSDNNLWYVFLFEKKIYIHL